jgi:hypothetical protein
MMAVMPGDVSGAQAGRRFSEELPQQPESGPPGMLEEKKMRAKQEDKVEAPETVSNGMKHGVVGKSNDVRARTAGEGSNCERSTSPR